ncbi:MAG: hypothetical protein U1F41_12445 [Burkholderiales bacterium]
MTVAVTGDSTSDAFLRSLCDRGIDVVRTARAAAIHSIMPKPCSRLPVRGAADIVVFWNVDAKGEAPVAKFAAAMPALRLVDVSPGAHAFEEFAATEDFQQRIAFDAAEYGARLDALVHKFDAGSPAWLRRPAVVLRNGVAVPAQARTACAASDAPSIVVNGRIALTSSSRNCWPRSGIVLARYPHATLHVHGSVEPRHADYARAVFADAADLLGTRLLLHGATPDAPAALARHDVAVVLGFTRDVRTRASRRWPPACLSSPTTAEARARSSSTEARASSFVTSNSARSRMPFSPCSATRAKRDAARSAGRARAPGVLDGGDGEAGHRRLFRRLRKGNTMKIRLGVDAAGRRPVVSRSSTQAASIRSVRRVRDGGCGRRARRRQRRARIRFAPRTRTVRDLRHEAREIVAVDDARRPDLGDTAVMFGPARATRDGRRAWDDSCLRCMAERSARTDACAPRARACASPPMCFACVVAPRDRTPASNSRSSRCCSRSGIGSSSGGGGRAGLR